MADFYNRGGGSLVLTDLEVDGTTVVVDETNDRVGIGTATPSTTLDVVGDITANNITANNGDCVFGNGQAATVSVTATAHNVVGKAISIAAGTTTAGTTNNIAGGSVTIKAGQGKGSGAGGDIIFQTANAAGSGSALNALATALTISDDLGSTFAGDVVIGGVTPKLTIGDADAEDTLIVFDGNAQDYRIGLDNGTNNLEIGVGAAHGTTPALTINSSTDIEIFGSLSINSAIADDKVSGTTATFTAGEDLVRGEVVYFKAGDSKMWKALATAVATSRCVAMAAEDISADDPGKFLLHGFCRDNGSFPAYTVGATLYTPEAETVSQNVPEEAAPDTDGDFVQVLGWAVTANMVFFNPSNDIIEVA